MIRSKDIALEQQEQDFNERMGLQNDEMMDEINNLHANIPPIDIGLMQPSLQTSEQIANGIIKAIEKGQISPIEFAVKKKCIIDAFDLVFKDDTVKKMVLNDVEKYGKEGAAMYGATIKVTSTGKYEYAKDPKWKELTESIKGVQDQIKAQEEKIKVATRNNAVMVDSDTGEIIATIVPCPKTDTVAVSFKK